MADDSPPADVVCDVYTSLVKDLEIESAAKQMVPLNLPYFPPEIITSICQSAQELFKKEDMVMRLNGPIVVIGDLHGHLLDLLRVIQVFWSTPSGNLLFLGDIIDRGEFSLETATLVFALKVKYPDRVFIIRGNHEFHFLCERCGFKDEIMKVYGSTSTVYHDFLGMFSQMPLVATIGEKILCVHGGIGPNWFSLRQVMKLERPIDAFGEDFLDCILWSDPNGSVDFFEPSTRGTGYIFGKNAIDEFLEGVNMDLLVRGHECVNRGCAYMFNQKLMTVFGASNYCGMVTNNSAVLIIDENGGKQIKQFVPLQYLRRGCVHFMKVSGGKMSEPVKQVPPNGSTGSLQQMRSPVPQSNSGGLHAHVRKLNEVGSLPVASPRVPKLAPLSGGDGHMYEPKTGRGPRSLGRGKGPEIVRPNTRTPR